jgi:hypothetical protein
MTGGVRPLPQVAVVVAHPVVCRHPGALLRLRFHEPGKRHAARMGEQVDVRAQHVVGVGWIGTSNARSKLEIFSLIR